MYRRLTKYGLSMLAVFGIAGCSYDTEIISSVEEKVPVTFEIATSEVSITRADTYTDAGVWTGGENVAVNDGTTTKTYTVSSNGSGGFKLTGSNTDNTFYWLIKSESKTFEAWYLKGNASYLNAKPTSMTVAADQTSADLNTYDLLYAQTDALTAATSTVPSLTFYHQMARLTVAITKGTGATSETVTSVSLGNNNVYRTRALSAFAASHYNGTSGGATWGTSSDQSTIKMKQVSESNYTCLVPPQTIGSGSTILLTVTTSDGGNTRTYTTTGSVSLQSGQHMTLNTTISRTDITIVPSITAWPASYSGTGTAGF